MTRDAMFRALGEVDDALVTRAGARRRHLAVDRSVRRRRRRLSLAAALIAALSLAVILPFALSDRGKREQVTGRAFVPREAEHAGETVSFAAGVVASIDTVRLTWPGGEEDGLIVGLAPVDDRFLEIDGFLVRGATYDPDTDTLRTGDGRAHAVTRLRPGQRGVFRLDVAESLAFVPTPSRRDALPAYQLADLDALALERPEGLLVGDRLLSEPTDADSLDALLDGLADE